MRIINCAICGKEVEAKCYNKKYCTDCAKIAFTITTQCANCGKEISILTKHKGARRFCSAECRKEYRKTHPKKKMEYKGTVVCGICGKEVAKTGSNQKYCDECREAARKNRTYTNTCQQCGKQFVVPQTKKNQKYCSKECYHKSREGVPRMIDLSGEKNPNWRGVRITIECAHCHKPFVRTHKKHKYCSMECASKEHGAKISGENNPHFKNRVEKECEFCGNKFQLPPFKARIRKYCSLQCANQALFLGAETSLEKAIRELLTENDIYFEQQHPFELYTVDFLLPDYNIVVECDGEYWHSRPDQKNRDRRKDAYLRSLGYTVIRLKEEEIEKDLQGCLEKIKQAIDSAMEVNNDEQTVNEGA